MWRPRTARSATAWPPPRSTPRRPPPPAARTPWRHCAPSEQAALEVIRGYETAPSSEQSYVIESLSRITLGALLLSSPFFGFKGVVRLCGFAECRAQPTGEG